MPDSEKAEKKKAEIKSRVTDRIQSLMYEEDTKAKEKIKKF